MGISEFISNASSILLSFIVAIFASYFVTIFHEVHGRKDKTTIFYGYFDKIKKDKFFFIVNIFMVILLITVLRNLSLVYAINNKHIPELRKSITNISTGMTERQVRDRLATLEDYFVISPVRNNGQTEALLIKPIELNTFIIGVEQIEMTLHFSENGFTNYSVQGGGIN